MYYEDGMAALSARDYAMTNASVVRLKYLALSFDF
jgi:hypothetical protein